MFTYAASAPTANQVTPGVVIIDFGSTCPTTTASIGATTTVANPSATAVIYPVEGAGANGADWCLQT